MGVEDSGAPGQSSRPGLVARFRGLAWLPVVFTVLVGIAVIAELRRMDVAQVLAIVPRSPLFWVAFAAYYLTGPASEWLIYRRLWAIPLSSLRALLRKLVCNELLLGYLGEAYFYAWARRRSGMTAAPFGAIKDVAILSAITGNAMTLLLVVAIWPLVRKTALAMESGPVVLSLAVVLATSLLAMLLRRKIFSLARADLGFILRMHFLRIVVSNALAAWLWHMVLPQVGLATWLFFAALRLLVSRLPFLPNKDVVFAALAAFALGSGTDIAALMTMMASAILLTHLVVGAALVVLDLVRPERGA